jgi:lipopolysaccharide transport system permease protein
MTSAEIPTIVIEPSNRLLLPVRTLWQYRELLYFLVWRDLKVRYKQTALGVLWVVLQPVISMLIYSLLFGRLLSVPTGGIPYPIFVFAALLPWNYFAGSLTKSSTSLVLNANLITKVYFPRILVPTSGVLSGLLDLLISFLVLAGLIIYYQIQLTPNILFLPGFLILAIITALGAGLWLSALNVQFRDVNHLIPFLVQVWMYATPVIYGSSLIPEKYRFILGLNPMTSVVEGFRWCLLGPLYSSTQLQGPMFIISIIIAIVLLISGLVFFRKTERTFADII